MQQTLSTNVLNAQINLWKRTEKARLIPKQLNEDDQVLVDVETDIPGFGKIPLSVSRHDIEILDGVVKHSSSLSTIYPRYQGNVLKPEVTIVVTNSNPIELRVAEFFLTTLSIERDELATLIRQSTLLLGES